MKFRLLLILSFLLGAQFAHSQGPGLIYPKSGFITSDTSIQFEWNSMANASDYHLQISSDTSFNTLLVNQTGIVSNTYTCSLSSGQKVFWRVRSYFGTTPSAWSAKFNLILFKPQMFSDLELWLEPSGMQIHVPSGRVNLWNDHSGHGRNAKQNDTTYMPEYDSLALNGMPSLLMDGINDYLKIDSPIVYKHIFSISNWTGPTSLFPNLNGLMSRNSGAFPNYILVGRTGYSDWVTFTNQSVFETNMRKNGVPGYSYSPLQDWKSVSGVANNAALIDQTLIGSYRMLASRYWQGHLSEVLVYSAALSNADRDIVEGYLRFKYGGPPVNLGQDKVIDYSFCGKVIDAGFGYRSYQWSTGDTTQQINVSASGTYWVKATDRFGYISRDTINVSIALPTLSITDTSLCLGSNSSISIPFPTSKYSITWSNNSPDSMLQTSVPGTYWVKVTDSLNCFITDTFEISVDSFPLIPSLGPDVSLCAGNQIGLVQGANQVSTYLWSDSSAGSTLTINNTGTYSLTVTNASGCQAIDTIQVSIKGLAPTMQFLADSACFGFPTNFTDSSTTLAPDSLASWTWDFGDGYFASGSSVQHQFSTYGTHNVLLTVTTDSGCVNTLQKNILVFPPPVASFTPFLSCQRTPVAFGDSSVAPQDQIVAWQWDFGDPMSGSNNVSALQHPMHSYDSTGNFTVQLIIETAAGCRDTSQAGFIVKPSPLADFSISTSCEKIATTFNNNSTSLIQNPITLRKWDFGDGSFSSLVSPIHVYQDDGIYPVNLWIQSLNGCSSEMFDTLKVGENPMAQILSSDGCVGEPLQLISGSTIQTGNITTYEWSFQGVAFSTDSMPWYPATDTGTYQIKLVVVSDMGCKDSTFNLIRIHPKPSASFTLSPEYGVPPHDVNFVNNSIGATHYLWYFQDGTQSQSFQPTHIYTDSGAFTITLVAINDWGCSDSAYGTVYVLTSKVDLSISQLNYEWKDGVLRWSADISNLGSRIIRKTQLEAWLPTGFPVQETCFDTIYPGQTIVYPFNSSFIVGDDELPGFLCVEAHALDVPDDAYLEDNVLCSILSSDFQIPRIFPNPATQQLMIEYLVPDQDNVKMEIIDPQGRLLKVLIDQEISKGRHLLDLNLYDVPSGLYLIRSQYREQVISKTFLKIDP